MMKVRSFTLEEIDELVDQLYDINYAEENESVVIFDEFYEKVQRAHQGLVMWKANTLVRDYSLDEINPLRGMENEELIVALRNEINTFLRNREYWIEMTKIPKFRFMYYLNSNIIDLSKRIGDAIDELDLAPVLFTESEFEEKLTLYKTLVFYLNQSARSGESLDIDYVRNNLGGSLDLFVMAILETTTKDFGIDIEAFDRYSDKDRDDIIKSFHIIRKLFINYRNEDIILAILPQREDTRNLFHEVIKVMDLYMEGTSTLMEKVRKDIGL